MVHTARNFVVALLLPMAFLGPAQAQTAPTPTSNGVEKYALVIGNSHYLGYRRNLKNAINDSKLMAQSLRKLGFKVQQNTDLDRGQMISVVSEFADSLPEGATAMVFYAGHGMQIGGASYLVPVDMKITSEQSVPLRAYPLKTLLERVSAAKSSVNIVVLDACRDNPFQPETPIKYRSFNNLGLAPVQAPVGTVVAYSTSPGQLAADGKDANSLYTAALAEVILEPSLSIEAVFKKVGVLVRNKTQDDQIPWFESSLSDEYFFLPPEGVSVVAGRSLASGEARRGNKPRRRDGSDPTIDISNVLWYLNLTEFQWNQMTDQMQRSIHQMTQDDLALLEHKALGGNVVAQTTLAMYGLTQVATATGDASTPAVQDRIAQARSWLRKAASAGFAVAQTELANLYVHGTGLPRDVQEARRLLELAANAQYPQAKRDLATLDWE